MKRILMFAAAVLVVSLSSCKKEEEKVIPPDYSDRTVIATLASPYDAESREYWLQNDYREYPKTKVSVDLNRTKYFWDENDRITVNGGVYSFQALQSESVAVFKTDVPMRDDSVSGVILHAFYPENIQIEGSKGCLPSRYTYNPDNKGDLSTIPMYASIPFVQEKVFLFRNIFPAFRITVDKSIGAVDSIVLSSVDEDIPICGPFDVSMGDMKKSVEKTEEAGRPVYEMYYECDVEFLGKTGYDRVTVDCGGASDIECYVPGVGGTITLYPSNGDPVVQNVADAGNPWMTYNFAFVDPTKGIDTMARKILIRMFTDFGNDVISEEKYGYSPMFVCQNLRGDDVLASDCDGRYPALAELNQFSYDWDNEAITAYFNGIVNHLHAANYFLEVSINRYNWNDATVSYMRAEVRAFRAYLQWLLMLDWGNVPIFDKLFGENEPPQQSSRADVLAYIEGELKEVEPILPQTGTSGNTCGRLEITKEFVYGLLGKMYMFYDKPEYAKAAEYCKKVIDSPCKLYTTSYDDLFHADPAGKCSSEKLFEIAIDNNDGFLYSTNWRTSSFKANPLANYSGTGNGYGCLGVRQKFGDDLWGEDPVPGDDRIYTTLRKTGDAIFGNNDYSIKIETYYEDPTIQGMSVSEKKESDKVGIKEPWCSESFYFPFKFQSRMDDLPGERRFTVMRVAEAYLLCAEAMNASGAETEAKKYIDAVRQRAYAPVKASYTIKDIQKDMSLELTFEGCRWYNILRWGEADTSSVLKDGWKNIPVLCDTMFRAPKSGEKIVWEGTTKENSRFYTYMIEAKGTKGFDPEKHKLFPYPKAFLEKNTQIEQNPGYSRF